MKLDDESHQPKTVIYRTDMVSKLEASLGILDYDAYFDNEFSKFKYGWELVDQTLEDIRNNVIPLREHNKMDLHPRMKPIEHMDKIWNGFCYWGIIRDSNDVNVVKKNLYYYKPENTFPVKLKDGKTVDWKMEVIQMPKLKRMVPVQQIKLDTWGVQTRYTWGQKHAHEGSSYGTVIEDGHFKYNTNQGVVAKFEPHEMNEEVNRTNIFSRSVYQEVTDVLSDMMGKNLRKFMSDMQKLKDWMKDLNRMKTDYDDDNLNEDEKEDFVL